MFLGRLTHAVGISGNMSEACALTRRTLAAVRPLTEKSKPSESVLWRYAWTLLATRCVGLRDPATAKAVARRLVDSSKAESLSQDKNSNPGSSSILLVGGFPHSLVGGDDPCEECWRRRCWLRLR